MSGTTAVPITTGADASLTPYVQPSFNYALRIWWAFYWPLSLVLFLTFAGFYFVSAELMHRRLMVHGQLDMRSTFVAVGIGWVASYFSMHHVVAKKFSHFRTGLVSYADLQKPAEVARTVALVFPVWIAYFWRNLIYSYVVNWIVMIPVNVILAVFSRVPMVHGILVFATQIALNGAVGLYIFYNNVIDERINDVEVTLLPLGVAPAVPVAPTQANAAAPAPIV